MRPDPHPLRWSSLILLLALGCGDSAVDEGDDEAGDATTVGESGDASDNAEAGSEGNTTTQGESETGSSDTAEGPEGEGPEGEGPEGEGPEDDVPDDESPDGSETVEDGSDSTETGEPPPNCVELDEPTCNATDTCTPYLGTPYEVTGDGTICLGEPQFIGCLFADLGCLPATGTLCMGDQAYDVASLCPPPPGFESCDPPVDAAMPCMP
jgi:hypothetical protein